MFIKFNSKPTICFIKNDRVFKALIDRVCSLFIFTKEGLLFIDCSREQGERKVCLALYAP